MSTMGIVYKLVGLRKTHGQSHSGVARETVPLTVNYNYSRDRLGFLYCSK